MQAITTNYRLPLHRRSPLPGQARLLAQFYCPLPRPLYRPCDRPIVIKPDAVRPPMPAIASGQQTP